MAKMLKVSFRDLVNFEVEEGTPINSLVPKISRYFNYPVMCAMVDNEIVGLDYPISKKCNIDFFDRSNHVGNSVYANSVNLMLVLAVKRLFGKDVDVIIKNSIDNGVACMIEGEGFKLDREILKNIETEMDKIVKQELAITPINVRRLDIIKYLIKQHEYDKAGFLKYITDDYIKIYKLDDYYDYSISSLANNTRDLPDYKLTYIKDNNFVLSIPTVYNPETTLNYKHVPIVFNTFNNYNAWESSMGIRNAADLNKNISLGNSKDLIRLAELEYEGQLHDIADEIYDRRNSVKMVLLAGPSSSGKTTSAKKLSYYLKTKGFNTIVLSTDDYFLDREETPVDENGEYDFESINAIDIKLFNKQMSKLLAGDKVLIPEYNFILGIKEYKNKWMQLKKNDIILIEGLHCLNDELTSIIPTKNKYKIYIGPFTQLNIDNHIRIHTSDTRRLRRIVRDNRTRGRNTADTLKMFGKIVASEKKYIYPYEKDADVILNTSLFYELGVLKVYAEPLLFAVEETDPIYPEALRLINFLKNILPIPSDDVPIDSVLREFIGGSGFYNE